MVLTTFYSKVYPSQTLFLGIALADADNILQQGLKAGRQGICASKTAGAALDAVQRTSRHACVALGFTPPAHAKQTQRLGGVEVHCDFLPAQSFQRLSGVKKEIDESPSFQPEVNDLFLGVPKDAVQEIMQNGFGLPNRSSIPLARSHAEARAAFARSNSKQQECSVLTVQARRATNEGGCTLRAHAHGLELHLPEGVGELASTFIEPGTPPGRKVTRFAIEDNVVLAGEASKSGSVILAGERGSTIGATSAEDDNGLRCKGSLRAPSSKDRSRSCPPPKYSSVSVPMNTLALTPKKEPSIESSRVALTPKREHSIESSRLMLDQKKPVSPIKARSVSCPPPKFSSRAPVNTLAPRQVKPDATESSTLMHDQKPLNSLITTTAHTEVSVSFSVEDLHVVDSHDPIRDPLLKAQILSKLGLFEENCIIKRVLGRCGGRNEGVWTIQDTQNHNMLIAKLAQSRGFYGFPSEVQKLKTIYKEHPSISSDASVAFPLKAFHCRGPNSNHYRDFIVMRKAFGDPLGDIITDRYRDGRMLEVMPILFQLGTFLAQFHKRYGGCQHGDFHASNIFYDTATRSFTLIDIADMGNSSVQKSDTEYFIETLNKMSVMRAFLGEGVRSFEDGYRMGK